jgi:hypothetical protein
MSSRVLDLNDFLYFVQVVNRGGFTAAGRILRIPKSTLSHRIQQLETELGVRHRECVAIEFLAGVRDHEAPQG